MEKMKLAEFDGVRPVGVRDRIMRIMTEKSLKIESDRE
jgi:hypothetical protein